MLDEIENQTEDSSEEKPVGFVERFTKERLEWTTTIREIASRFKHIDNMAEVQIDLYSNRQQCVDYTQELSVLQSRLKKKYESVWKKAYDDLALDQDFRYNAFSSP